VEEEGTMRNASWQLAQVNIGRARGAPTDPVMLEFVARLMEINALEFVARLTEINALADQSPGFVWRLQTEDGDATAVRPYADQRILINMSVWTDLEALRAYVFRTAHAAVMRRRREWFERSRGFTSPSGGSRPATGLPWRKP
jgi:hypothetical protein